jgi:hypothetical protein
MTPAAVCDKLSRTDGRTENREGVPEQSSLCLQRLRLSRELRFGNSPLVRKCPGTPGLSHYIDISSARSRVSEPVDALEQASVLAADASEVGRNNHVLVAWPRKVVRKSSTRQASSDLGIHARRATDSRDEGTCRQLLNFSGRVTRHIGKRANSLAFRVEI